MGKHHRHSHKNKSCGDCDCQRKKYRRKYITRTTKIEGGTNPSTADVLSTTKPFGGCFTQSVGNCGSTLSFTPSAVSNGTPSQTNGTNNTIGCGNDPRREVPPTNQDARFDPLRSGGANGSNETHLHTDRLGNVYCHSHPGGDVPHSHDANGEDIYVGRVGDCRSLTQDPDRLNVDETGGVPGAINTSNTQNGNGTQNCSGTQNGNIGGSRPYNGNLTFGPNQLSSNSGSNQCQTISASFCNGNSLGQCNLANAAPATRGTPAPARLNLQQRAPDLRGFNNVGTSSITPSLSTSRKPTVYRSKIKEVYCC